MNWSFSFFLFSFDTNEKNSIARKKIQANPSRVRPGGLAKSIKEPELQRKYNMGHHDPTTAQPQKPRPTNG
jgi:hypothetical protein